MGEFDFKFMNNAKFLDLVLEQFGHDAHEFCSNLVKQANDYQEFEDECENVNQKIESASSIAKDLVDVFDEMDDLMDSYKELKVKMNEAYEKLEELQMELS
jgi:seryl-tRNA synthetase